MYCAETEFDAFLSDMFSSCEQVDRTRWGWPVSRSRVQPDDRHVRGPPFFPFQDTSIIMLLCPIITMSLSLSVDNIDFTGTTAAVQTPTRLSAQRSGRQNARSSVRRWRVPHSTSFVCPFVFFSFVRVKVLSVITLCIVGFKIILLLWSYRLVLVVPGCPVGELSFVFLFKMGWHSSAYFNLNSFVPNYP